MPWNGHNGWWWKLVTGLVCLCFVAGSVGGTKVDSYQYQFNLNLAQLSPSLWMKHFFLVDFTKGSADLKMLFILENVMHTHKQVHNQTISILT